MVDCCSTPGLMPLTEAKTRLLASVNSVTETQSVAIIDADKRVLAQPIYSPINVPGHNNSAMDGYALAFKHASDECAEANSQFNLVGSAMAGQPFQGRLAPGEAVRIMTGAVVPDTADAVEMQENIHISESIISLSQAVKKHAHIRFSGEDIAINSELFTAGHVISAIDIGLLASLGLADVSVYRKLRVAVFSTGDELKLPGQKLKHGDIYESNRLVLIAMLKRLAVEVIDLGVIADDVSDITAAFMQADAQADAVISSGGVSVGDADYTKTVLAELGDINFWKVAIKPGKPFAFGQLPNSVFFGLPGNPVSAAVTFHQLVVPTLEKMMAKTVEHQALMLPAMTTTRIKKRPGRTDFQRGWAAINEQGELTVTPLENQSSGVLSSISRANCYIVLAQLQGEYQSGELVNISLFDQLIGA